jgi:hypothetical protein
VSTSAHEIFEKYIWAGAVSRNANAVAALFTSDGVLEAPLVPPGHIYPRRLEGREAIRTGLAAYYKRVPRTDLTPNTAESRYELHLTDDPEVFIAEIDTVFDGAGAPTFVSLVQIFRLSDGLIASMRDYFHPDQTVS